MNLNLGLSCDKIGFVSRHRSEPLVKAD
jgi:hypothetical protein